ncbi:MAG: BREX-1 system adenine-specific DNA-methyltransferase PglX, partial [Pirellulaceae bacterium]
SEVDFSTLGLEIACRENAVRSGKKWFPYNKGGEFRKWYGNEELAVNWLNDGHDIRQYGHGVFRSLERYFSEGLTWGGLSISLASFRYSPAGHLFDSNKGPMLHGLGDTTFIVLGFLNSAIVSYLLDALNPTVGFQTGDISRLPIKHLGSDLNAQIMHVVRAVVQHARDDWDSFETSWNFQTLPVLQHSASKLEQSQNTAETECLTRFTSMKELEEDNNRLFIEAYGLQDELSPEVPDDQITLYRPNREEDIKRLLSYAIGCVMGRYSLDKPGLIYAHSGNQGFDSSQYQTFRADDDGIIPLLETDWGIRDDATNRFVEFIGVAWPKEHLEENVKFVADNLVATGNEQPRETIRRYLATGFYKHHLSMYKKRPIYWLFSSGKLRAFQCLVYLHRYNEGTLARMRTEYVIPLQGQIAARIDQLEGDKAKATSTSHRTKIQKEQDKLKKQQAELATFEEKLKHYADMRISLDLDDGVKVNYAKFGDLLAESKAITGGKDDE